MKFTKDDKMLASCSKDHIIIWNFELKTIHKKLTDQNSWIVSLDFSVDEKFLATGSYNNSLFIWNFKSLEVQKIIKFKSKVVNLRYSPNGKHLIVGING